MITLLINHRLSVHLPVEFVVHGYFVFVSSIIMVSATDFLSIFLSMEAQAIAVIFAIALDANNRKATEAA